MVAVSLGFVGSAIQKQTINIGKINVLTNPLKIIGFSDRLSIASTYGIITSIM